VPPVALYALRVYQRHNAVARLALGAGIVLAVTAYLARGTDTLLARHLLALSGVQAALVATLGTALATGVGALPVLLARRIPMQAQDAMLGFGAGVMLAASVFSLIIPALDASMLTTGSRTIAAWVAAGGLALGALTLLAMDRMLPHEHFVKGHEGPLHPAFARVWLFVFAITLHNVPEGLAVGVGFAGENNARALPLALGIAIQNMPEGLAVAAALLTLDYSPARATAIALATGMVEPVGGLLGAGVVSISTALLPWALTFAAGAMLFVISHEIIPESHRNGHETSATVGLLIGFVLMMMFDTTMG
jgi:zinc transporter, ZIP family